MASLPAYYTDDPQEFASILPGDIVMYKNAEGRETIGVVSDAAVDEETDLTTAFTVISGDVATGCESDGETTIDQVAEVEVALNEVTSFVSVNAAEGYGISDLMEEDDAALVAEAKNLTNCITNVTATETSYKSDGKEGYKSNLKMDFKIPKEGLVADEYQYLFELPDGVALDSSVADKLLGQELEIAGEGSVKEGYFKFVKKEDGTYAILLKFNKEYLDHTTTVRGYINFWSEFGVGYETKTGTVEIPFNEETKLEIPSKEIKHPDNETNIYDIGVTKKGSYTEDGKLTYTVNIVSKKGTPGKVSFDDKIKDLQGLTLSTPTITVEKCTVTETRTNKDSGWSQAGSTEWETVNDHTLHVTESGEIQGTLPKMETNVSEDGLERTHTEYEVTYVYKVSDMKNVNYQLENKVGVSSSSTDKTLKIEHTDTAKVPLNNKYTITKTAGNYANGKIKWTITLNSNELDITNAVLKDTMVAGSTTIADVLAKASDITIDPNSGFEYIDAAEDVTTDPSKRVGIRFTKIDGQPNYKKYTIVYYTSHEQSDNKYTVNNTATLEPDGSDAVTTEPIGKDVNPIFYTKKALANEVKIEDGKMIIPWESSVDFSNTDKIEKGTRFYDSFVVAGANKEHAMTPEQARAMTIEWVDSKGNSYGRLDKASYELTFIKEATTNNDTGITSGTTADLENPNEKIHGYKIEFITNVSRPANATAVRVKYSSTVTASEMHEGDIFRNLFKINDFQRWERWSYIPSFPKITKMDGEDKTGTTPVVSEDDTITWKIKIHTDGFLHGSVTIHDDLPVGVVVESVKRQGDNSVITVTPDKEFKGKWNNDILTGIYNKNEKTLEMTLSNVNNLMRNADYVFIIKCRAVSDPNDENAAIVPGQSYEYTNNVSAWFDDTIKIGDASQTQNWSEKDNTPVIEPIGKNVQTDSSGQTLNYTVEINPEGKKLLENSTEGLRVRDTLSVQIHPDYVTLKDDAGQGTPDKVTVSAALVQKSVKLCYATRNAETGKLESTGQEVPGYKMTLDSHVDPEHPERMLYLMEFTALPDDKPMLLTYTYDLVSDIDINYKNRWQKYGYWEQNCIKNTAELEKIGYTTTTKDTRLEFAHAGTSGSVVSTYNLTLKKVAEGDYTTLLPEAVFQLRKYENGEFVDVAGMTYETDSAGTITIQQGKNDGDFKFDTNTLYCLVETEPPKGYALSQTPVYFYFKDDKDSVHTLPTIEGIDQAVDLNSQSKQVYVQNEPNLTSVTVEKKWQNSDGTKLDNPPVNEIKFNLVQLVSSTPPISSSSATVKGAIKSQGTGNAVYTFDGTTPYSEGTVMTLTITYPTAINALQYNNMLIPKIFWNGAEVTPDTEKPDGDYGIVKWTYTCILKAGQNTIGGYIAGYDSSKHVIQEPQYTQPTAPEYTVNKVYGTYTLTAANNWRMVIGNLPRSNLDRTQYYSYKIVETTGGDGYTVTYNTESGVVGGYLVMVNTKTPEQEEPTYELPSTGSPGGTVPYTAGGAAIALAAVLCGYNSRRKRKRGEE